MTRYCRYSYIEVILYDWIEIDPSFYIWDMAMVFNATNGGRRSRDRMVVGFMTAYAISAYHHQRCEFESRS
jgi:hypothetical protein